MAENRFKKGIANIKQSENQQLSNISSDTKYTHDTYNINNTKYDNVEYVTHETQQPHNVQITRQYDKLKKSNTRGKREERYGLLLDKKLKDDIKKLVNAEGSRSMNDFIVNILISYVEAPENQEILTAYEAILKLKNK